MGTQQTKENKHPKQQTPTFLLELPLVVNQGQACRLRFVLQQPEEGKAGFLLWKDEQLAALIDGKDPVVTHGLAQRIKYARLIRRPASSSRAQGADVTSSRYFVQLALEGTAYHKAKHPVGTDVVGLDVGPSTVAIVPRVAPARLEVLAEQLAPQEKQIRRLQRQMDRQRRAANLEHYDEQGRPKKRGKGYEATRRRKASKERMLAAHRKSLHGRMVHEIVMNPRIHPGACIRNSGVLECKP
jgi:hypothetical protein